MPAESRLRGGADGSATAYSIVGLPVAQAEFVNSAQDWTRPELDSCAVWVVEWTQGIYLGEEEWPWPNQPRQFVVGYQPRRRPDLRR